MKKLAVLFVLLLCAVSTKAQTVSNLGGTGSLQFFNDDGTVLTTGMVYIFQAQTSTPVAVYVDSSGTNQQPNPVPLGGNGRAQIWLVSGTFVKVVLCSSNTDGAFCSARHQLFVADNIAIGSSGGGGGGGGTCSTGCTGFFISGTASPATSGVLRCSSGDTCLAFRNAAGSANLGLTKDANDLLSWPTPLKFPENAGATGVLGFDLLWPDSSVHRWKMANNGGTATQVVASGNDISTTDAVASVHFGSSQAPFSNTLPSAGQVLSWNGSAIAGLPQQEVAFGTGGATMGVGSTATCATAGFGTSNCVATILVNAHTLIRFSYNLALSPFRVYDECCGGCARSHLFNDINFVDDYEWSSTRSR